MRIALRSVPIDYNVFTTISRTRVHTRSVRILMPLISSEILVAIDLYVDGSPLGTTIAQARYDKKAEG